MIQSVMLIFFYICHTAISFITRLCDCEKLLPFLCFIRELCKDDFHGLYTDCYVRYGSSKKSANEIIVWLPSPSGGWGEGG